MPIVTSVRRIGLLVVLMLIGIGLALYLLHPREPVYEGTRLSDWLEDLYRGSGERRNRAKEALLAMGTSALPRLEELLHTKDSNLRKGLMRWSNRQSAIRINLVSAQEQRRWAVAAYTFLRSTGRVNTSEPADFVLIMNTTFTNKADVFLFQDVWTANPDRKPDVSAVIASLKAESHHVRSAAARCLGENCKDAPAVVAALAETLGSDANDMVRMHAADALAAIRVDARAAVPDLVKALKDKNSNVAWAAAVALKKIDPMTATSVGLK